MYVVYAYLTDAKYRIFPQPQTCLLGDIILPNESFWLVPGTWVE